MNKMICFLAALSLMACDKEKQEKSTMETWEDALARAEASPETAEMRLSVARTSVDFYEKQSAMLAEALRTETRPGEIALLQVKYERALHDLKEAKRELKELE